jgi:hypothetical protein
MWKSSTQWLRSFATSATAKAAIRSRGLERDGAPAKLTYLRLTVAQCPKARLRLASRSTFTTCWGTSWGTGSPIRNKTN